MKRVLQFGVILFIAGCLAACNPGEPVPVTRTVADETAVPQNTVIAENTAVPPTFTPTFAATQTSTATIAAASTATSVPLFFESTPTPIPTPTAFVTPTPMPEPVLLTPIEWVSIERIFPLDYDLLYISQGYLHLWLSQIGQVRMILPPLDSDVMVSDWRVSKDGRTVLVATTAVDEDAPGFTLLLFDVESREISELWSETESYLFGFALAADGGAAGFITSAVSRQEEGGTETVKVIDREQGEVTVLSDCPNTRPLDQGGGPFDYTNRCGAMVASPDGRSWLWSDIVGLWQGEVGQLPQLLVAHEFYTDALPRIFRPTGGWSPNGRYLLLRANYGGGQERFVLDTVTSSAIQMPDYENNLAQLGDWLWTEDNRLAALRGPIYEGEENNFAELWHIEDGELALDASLALPIVNDDSPPTAWSVLGDGRFAFVINHLDLADAATRNLYLIDSFDQPPRPLVSLPPLPGTWSFYGQSLTWMPDDSGVAYIKAGYRGYELYYIPADGSILYDLTDVLGRDITALLWLP